MVLPFLQNTANSVPSEGGEDTEVKAGGANEECRMDQDRPWWFKTAREVRESDESKVRDYKEDIDTLLVIGALFSAVVTALMIESYKNLSPDPAELSVQILLHISQQLSSYTVNGPFFNSTMPSFTLPDFIPSKAMIITNAMWFASLMISLMAASYGMLVKQWLREYLGNIDTSPLARLRIRCFRYPALLKWKVFEIVAILPLLLQMALGLFFIGLCYFASTIHPVIQWTVIPLVVTWALLFVAATFAPILSASCPYKTTFLKGIMKKLRRARFIISYEVNSFFPNGTPGSLLVVSNSIRAIMKRLRKTCSIIPRLRIQLFQGVPSGPEEEEDIAQKHTEDFEVLAQVDLTQADDGLISPALVDLSRQRPGQDVVNFIFTILGHRNAAIQSSSINALLAIQEIPIPLLRAVAIALAEVLRNEHARKTTGLPRDGQTPQLIDWDPWVQISCCVLLCMPNHIELSLFFKDALSNCLSVTSPRFIDDLVNSVSHSWPSDKKAMFMKAVIRFTDPSSADPTNFRPLHLLNLSVRVWEQSMALFASMIFKEGELSSLPYIWDQDTQLAFRGLFGDSQHLPSENLCHRIQASFTTDQLVTHLLSPISGSHIQGHGRRIILYVYRLLRIHRREIRTLLDLSSLSEQSWSTVSKLLIATIKDELEVRGGLNTVQNTSELDECILDATHALLFSAPPRRNEDGMSVVASLFQAYPEALSDGLVVRLVMPAGSLPLPHTVRSLLRLFPKNPDPEMEDPWATLLEISTSFSLPDILVNIVAKSLTNLFRQYAIDNPDDLKWISWAFQIIFSCVDASDKFSNSTRTAIEKLLLKYAYSIVHVVRLTGENNEYQFERLWSTIRLINPLQQLSLITLLLPNFARIPMQWLQKYASDQNKTTTEVLLRAPTKSLTRPWVVSTFTSHHVYHSRSTADCSRSLDELKPLTEYPRGDIAWSGILRIAYTLACIGDPDWPVWMKKFLADSEDMKMFRSTKTLSHNLKLCLYYNAVEFIALIASDSIEHLDHIPSDIFFFRYGTQFMYRVLKAFEKHPEPLSPAQAEICLMRQFVNAKFFRGRLVWTFTTHNHVDSGNTPPRYACVSFVLRVLQYDLGPKHITIPQRDIRSPLDLSRLEKEVWDDVSAAAAEVLNRDKFYGLEEDYFGGRATYDRARMDAIMILLANSPHPFSTDLSYQVLDKDDFFRWDDNPAVESDARQQLQERRWQRIEEGRRSGRLQSNIRTRDGDQDEEGDQAVEETEPIVEPKASNQNDVSNSKDSHEDHTPSSDTEDQCRITSTERPRKNEHTQGEDKDDRNMQGDTSKEDCSNVTHVETQSGRDQEEDVAVGSQLKNLEGGASTM